MAAMNTEPPPAQEKPKRPTNFVGNWERKRMQESMKRKARQDMVNHAITEWTLIRCLAYAERMIAVALCVCFPLDLKHDFLSYSGIEFTIVGLAILGPVFGIVMFGITQIVYAARRRAGTLPKSVAGLKKIIYVICAFFSPVVAFGTYYVMKIYFEMVAAAPIMQQFKDLSDYSFFPK